MLTSELGPLSARDPLRTPRRFFMAIFLFCLVGTGGELLLLEHFKEFSQKVPLALIGLSLVVLVVHAFVRRAASLRLFQGMMILFFIGGAAGLLLHYRGNVEFELERHPGAAGFELFIKALMGATPALAPGTMMQLGLLGLAYTYRHPLLARPKRSIELE